MDADQQGAWLDSLGPVASWSVREFGLEFDDGHIWMDQWVAAGWISPASVPDLTALNDLLDEICGEANATLWIREGLAEHQAWREVRARAMTFSSLSTD